MATAKASVRRWLPPQPRSTRAAAADSFAVEGRADDTECSTLSPFLAAVKDAVTSAFESRPGQMAHPPPWPPLKRPPQETKPLHQGTLTSTTATFHTRGKRKLEMARRSFQTRQRTSPPRLCRTPLGQLDLREDALLLVGLCLLSSRPSFSRGWRLERAAAASFDLGVASFIENPQPCAGLQQPESLAPYSLTSWDVGMIGAMTRSTSSEIGLAASLTFVALELTARECRFSFRKGC